MELKDTITLMQSDDYLGRRNTKRLGRENELCKTAEKAGMTDE